MHDMMKVEDGLPEPMDICLVRGENEEGEFYAVCWGPDADIELWLMVSPYIEDVDYPDYELRGVTHWRPLIPFSNPQLSNNKITH